MKRPSTVSQNVRAFVTAAAIAVGAMGCASGNDKTGAAGSGGGGSGGGGSSGTACTLADVNRLFLNTATPSYIGCTLAGACHDSAGSAAGLDLMSAGWQTKLVGKGPSATAGASADLHSKCSGMNLVYLKAGSNPAAGLLLDKLDPSMTVAPCGAHMPNLGAPFTAAQFACVKSWATTLTAP